MVDGKLNVKTCPFAQHQLCREDCVLWNKIYGCLMARYLNENC